MIRAMVFKLVRTDTEDPCKIQLPVGVHVFGRGVFLDCEDKRVSRKHGLLEVTADTVILKALHRNPCFFIRKGSEETEILREDGNASLGNGDKFGLLPNSYWYELLHCTLPPDIKNKPLENIPNITNNDVQNGQTNKEKCAANTNSMDGVVNEELDESAFVDFQLNDTVDNFERPDSPSVIEANQASTEANQASTAANQASTAANQASTAANEASTAANQASTAANQASTDDQSSASQTQNYQVDSTPQVATPSKRALSSSEPDDVKRIKTEPLDTNAGVNDGNAQAGPSNTDQKVKDEPPPSPVKPPNNPGPSRERCWYGAQCYRKNPQHKADFSHPSDGDWGSGPRALCPFGAGCQKRDPRHWRDHDHPSAANAPQNPLRPGRGKKPRAKQNQSDSESSEDSGLSPAPDANLPAKRARKPVQRPSYSGSESQNEYDLEDPFLTDDEDDWQPPTSQSQDY